MCAFAFPTSESQIVHYCITVGLLFVLLLFIGIFSYYKIYLKTHEHQQKQTLVECYCSWLRDFCVAGYQCEHLFSGFETSPRIVVMLSMFCFYLSASANPFIYAFTNGEFRREFRKLLSCYCRKARIADNEVIEREE